ncbi:MAG: DUF4352 domain-containing protein [Nocardiopsaceae bacterium]|nr:DUF4352 domain-containing protein [Nocardiopsaceae bacterium]
MTYPAPDQFPHQPRPKKKRGCLWAALIGIGVFLLFGFAGCMAVIVGAGGESSSPGADAAQESADGDSGESEEKEEKTAAMGDTVEDGSFAFTVTDVQTGVDSVGDEFLSETPQGQFVIVDVTVENVGDAAQMFDGSDQKLFDADGTEYANDTEAEIYLENSESFLEEINPGNKVEAQVVFDIPADVEPASIELHDSPFSGGIAVKL